MQSMKIEHIQSFMVIGISNDLSPTGMKDTWDQLYARMNEIPYMINPKIGYGLLVNRRYTACMEVASVGNLPEGMDGMVVPANDYAIFMHKGKIKYLKQTWDLILKQYASQLDMLQPNFERYDERFNPVSDDSIVEIYIPLKK